MFGIEWLRNGVPVDKETSVLTSAAEVIAAAALMSAPAKAGPLDAFAMIPPGNAQLQPQTLEPDQPAFELPDNLQRQVVSFLQLT